MMSIPEKKRAETAVKTLIRTMMSPQQSVLQMDKWEWPQGVALFALYRYSRITGDEMLVKWLTEWFDTRIAAGLPDKNVNTMCPLLTLTYLVEKSQNPAHLAICHEWLGYVLHQMPRTEEGGFQHVVTGWLNEGQLWDDTLYMTVLFVARMGVLLDDDDYVQESIRQFLIHLKYLSDPVTGLFFHGWTFVGKHHYGKALWGRGNAWYTAGLVDYLDMVSVPAGVKLVLTSALERQVRALAGLQSSVGLWHTLLDDPTSYLETSASAAFAYGILKGVRRGLLPPGYAGLGWKAVTAVLDQIDQDGLVQNVSDGTALWTDLDEYRKVGRKPMPYGQSMALMLLVEVLQ